MTLENLEKANELHRQIEEKKRFLNAFDSGNGSLNRILAYDFWEDEDGESGKDYQINLSEEPELSEMVRGCLEKRISELEKQFEEL